MREKCIVRRRERVSDAQNPKLFRGDGAPFDRQTPVASSDVRRSRLLVRFLRLRRPRRRVQALSSRSAASVSSSNFPALDFVPTNEVRPHGSNIAGVGAEPALEPTARAAVAHLKR